MKASDFSAQVDTFASLADNVSAKTLATAETLLSLLCARAFSRAQQLWPWHVWQFRYPFRN